MCHVTIVAIRKLKCAVRKEQDQEVHDIRATLKY